MNGYFYSAGIGGFLYEGDRAAFDAAAGWPADAVAISDRWYNQLIDGQTKGKMIVPNEQGKPVLKAIAPDYPAMAELQKQHIISDAMQSVSVIQLKLQAGRALTESESVTLAAVLDYIDEVENIDTASVTGQVDWPQITR